MTERSRAAQLKGEWDGRERRWCDNQQVCGVREMRKLTQGSCQNAERYNVEANVSENTSFALYRDMNCNSDERGYVASCTRKRCGFSRSVTSERNWNRMGKGRCRLCSGKEDAKYLLLSCVAARKWR